MVKCYVLKKLGLTSKKMVTWNVVSHEVTIFDRGQREKVAENKELVKTSEMQPVVQETASRNNESRKREERRSGNESSGKKNCQEVGR